MDAIGLDLPTHHTISIPSSASSNEFKSHGGKNAVLYFFEKGLEDLLLCLDEDYSNTRTITRDDLQEKIMGRHLFTFAHPAFSSDPVYVV